MGLNEYNVKLEEHNSSGSKNEYSLEKYRYCNVFTHHIFSMFNVF